MAFLEPASSLLSRPLPDLKYLLTGQTISPSRWGTPLPVRYMREWFIRKKFFATDAEDAEDARVFAINTRCTAGDLDPPRTFRKEPHLRQAIWGQIIIKPKSRNPEISITHRYQQHPPDHGLTSSLAVLSIATLIFSSC